MKKEYKVHIWDDDCPEEIIERITTILVELGIVVRKVNKSVEEQIPVTTYELSLAEPLDDGH